jgi:hypothetical protein
VVAGGTAVVASAAGEAVAAGTAATPMGGALAPEDRG